MADFDYRLAFNQVGLILASRFPECEITVTDMVRLICIENDTLRMALKMPLPQTVLDAIEKKS